MASYKKSMVCSSHQAILLSSLLLLLSPNLLSPTHVSSTLSSLPSCIIFLVMGLEPVLILVLHHYFPWQSYLPDPPTSRALTETLAVLVPESLQDFDFSELS